MFMRYRTLSQKLKIQEDSTESEIRPCGLTGPCPTALLYDPGHLRMTVRDMFECVIRERQDDTSAPCLPVSHVFKSKSICSSTASNSSSGITFAEPVSLKTAVCMTSARPGVAVEC